MDESEEFIALKSRIARCEICADLPLGPKPLFQLHEKARILLAGQAPGRVTHMRGRPFDDASGDRLRAWMGVDRDTFYDNPKIAIFPMGLCFPGVGKGGDAPPRAICAQTWRATVIAALSRIDLTLVLGRYAIAWHLPDQKSKNIADILDRATPETDDTLVLPHPSPRNNRWLRQHPTFEADIVPVIQRRIAALLAAD
ncbi:uracil-DNA glycosylase family protein [Oceaniglobus ichthyenteri]|uniref:uracil-DNA glycosylase family protein n=1 Tax=Oceaniglobus ichthyenteri TaxID=2136177 RepID=UPI000D333543|nr:uracil-DNA glycosylase family protein [Oceaniglobus ichthyenteri]